MTTTLTGWRHPIMTWQRSGRFPGRSMKVHVVSDRLCPFEATLSLRLVDLVGQTAWSQESGVAGDSARQFQHCPV